MESLNLNNLTKEQINVLREEAIKNLDAVIYLNNERIALLEKYDDFVARNKPKINAMKESANRRYDVNPSTVSKVSFVLKMALKVVAMKLFKIPYEALPTPTYNSPKVSNHNNDAQETVKMYNDVIDKMTDTYNKNYDKMVDFGSHLKKIRGTLMRNDQYLLKFYECCIEGFNEISTNKFQYEKYLTNLAESLDISYKLSIGEQDIKKLINNSVNSLNNILKQSGKSFRR